jgi:hypothetical protein
VTYLNFNKVVPPYPNDPLVDVNNHLNANWDTLETKLNALNLGSTTIISPDVGQEIVSSTPNFRVWNGSAWRDPDNISAAWTAWNLVPLSGNVVTRTSGSSSFPLKWRSNPLIRQVQLVGGLQRDVSQTAWATGFTVITDGASGIPSTQGPIGGLSLQESAAALPNSPANGACGRHQIDISGGFVRIQSRYVGGPGGGNFLMYNGVKWWY